MLHGIVHHAVVEQAVTQGHRDDRQLVTSTSVVVVHQAIEFAHPWWRLWLGDVAIGVCGVGGRHIDLWPIERVLARMMSEWPARIISAEMVILVWLKPVETG